MLNRMAGSACRPPPGSADKRVGTGDAISSRSMHQRGSEDPPFAPALRRKNGIKEL